MYTDGTELTTASLEQFELRRSVSEMRVETWMRNRKECVLNSMHFTSSVSFRILFLYMRIFQTSFVPLSSCKCSTVIKDCYALSSGSTNNEIVSVHSTKLPSRGFLFLVFNVMSLHFTGTCLKAGSWRQNGLTRLCWQCSRKTCVLRCSKYSRKTPTGTSA
jgi:hypothetical protein